MNAETFNALYEVGIPVFAYPGARPEDDADAERVVTRTRTKAELFRGCRDVVWVEDLGAYVLLSHVDVVTEDEWKTAKAAEEAASKPEPAPDDALAAYESVDFTELMDADAAAFVGRMRDQMLGEIQRLRKERDEARASALNEAAEFFDGLAAAEPNQGYRFQVMRGAANDIRRLNKAVAR